MSEYALWGTSGERVSDAAVWPAPRFGPLTYGKLNKFGSRQVEIAGRRGTYERRGTHPNGEMTIAFPRQRQYCYPADRTRGAASRREERTAELPYAAAHTVRQYTPQ